MYVSLDVVCQWRHHVAPGSGVHGQNLRAQQPGTARIAAEKTDKGEFTLGQSSPTANPFVYMYFQQTSLPRQDDLNVSEAFLLSSSLSQ
jgi:hypothetical protein